MKRLLCIWFPNWPIQRLMVARPELKRGAVVLFGRDPRRGQRVVACSRAAQRQGIRVGMPLAEATARVHHAGSKPPSVQTPTTGRSASRSLGTPVKRALPDDYLSGLGIWPHQAGLDRQALEELVVWGGAFSPQVGFDETPTLAGLLLDVTGIAARHGGEVKLAQRMQAQLRRRGYWGQLGLADTLGAAWALAHFGHVTPAGSEGEKNPEVSEVHSSARSAVVRRWIHIAPPQATRQTLAHLPVAALRLSDTTVESLSELGVEHIDQLWDLPRAGISARLGHEVLQRLDQALDPSAEIMLTHQPLPEFVTHWQAEHATDRYEVIQQVVEHLSHHLAEQLSNQQQGALQLCCRLHCEARSGSSRTDHAESDAASTAPLSTIELQVSLFQPTLQASYLWQLLHVQLESLSLPGPVAVVELRALATVSLCTYQRQLWGHDPMEVDVQPWAHFIDRLSNRLGPNGVCATRLRKGALPESAYRLIPLAGSEHSRTRLTAAGQRTPPAPHHRPLQLIHPPLAVDMQSQSPTGAPLQFAVAQQPLCQVTRSWGPERIETAWWEGPCVRRDYYRVHCRSGARLWLFCSLNDQRWFLHGEFA